MMDEHKYLGCGIPDCTRCTDYKAGQRDEYRDCLRRALTTLAELFRDEFQLSGWEEMNRGISAEFEE